MSSSESNTSPFDLSPADAAAFDALVEAGFDLTKVAETQRERASKLSAVLGLLDSPGVGHSSNLADRVMSRLGTTSDEQELTLSARDGAAFDALAEANFDLSLVSSELAPAASRHAALASLITAKPAGVEWSPDLAARTFDLVMLNDESGAIPIEREFTRTALGRRFWDAVAIAATLMLGASVVLPILGAVRHRQMLTACSGRLGEVATAMSAYAGANGNALPAATASMGGTWWNVGKDRSSNSANLFTLAREGYLKLRSLTCPGLEQQVPECASGCEANAQTWDWPDINHVSYSYQIAGQSRPRWNDTVSLAILADRSPVVLRALRQERVTPLENSPNHNGKGQSVLFIDGSVRWLATPVLGYAKIPTGPGAVTVAEDNIWLPWQVEVIRQAQSGGEVTLNGREVPTSPFDTFLAP